MSSIRKKKKYRLGDLQLRIMRVLWECAPASVAQVQAGLGGALAYTTVATMLRKLEGRGLLTHRELGRKFVYQPIVSADDVTRSMADDLVDRLFNGSLTDAVSHLLESRDVSPPELVRLQELIAQRCAQRGESRE